MSFRTTLIIINLAAVAALLGFIVYRVVSVRRNPDRTTRRTSRRSSTTTCSKARTSSGCSASR